MTKNEAKKEAARIEAERTARAAARKAAAHEAAMAAGEKSAAVRTVEREAESILREQEIRHMCEYVTRLIITLDATRRRPC